VNTVSYMSNDDVVDVKYLLYIYIYIYVCVCGYIHMLYIIGPIGPSPGTSTRSPTEPGGASIRSPCAPLWPTRLAFIPRVDRYLTPCWPSRAPCFHSTRGRAQLTFTSLLSHFTYGAKSFYYSTQPFLIFCYSARSFDSAKLFCDFSLVILWLSSVILKILLSHSLDFAIVLSHLCFPQWFYDFLSHFVRHRGGGGRGVGGRDTQSFFVFCHSAQSICVFLSDFVISSAILWFSQSFCETQGQRRHGHWLERRWVIFWILP
jgi:hypothetical protein